MSLRPTFMLIGSSRAVLAIPQRRLIHTTLCRLNSAPPKPAIGPALRRIPNAKPPSRQPKSLRPQQSEAAEARTTRPKPKVVHNAYNELKSPWPWQPMEWEDKSEVAEQRVIYQRPFETSRTNNPWLFPVQLFFFSAACGALGIGVYKLGEAVITDR